MTGDPSTETWRETVGLSTSAQLRQTQRDLAASQQDLSHVERQLRDAEDDLNSVAAERDGVREELARQAATNEDLRATLAIRDRQLREAQHELEHVTFQQSMLQTRLDHAREEQGSCAWRDLAVDAMRERDLIRAQLDDAIAGFRAKLEQARAEVLSTREPGDFGGER